MPSSPTPTLHADVRRRRTGRRRKGILWEYNGDGQHGHERLDRVSKRYWRRWARRLSRQMRHLD